MLTVSGDEFEFLSVFLDTANSRSIFLLFSFC